MAEEPKNSWPIKDIIYVSIVGFVMLAAIFEWILWLSAFLYCLVKAYQKAENISTRILAVIMMVLFSILRIIFLPVMIVTLPLPSMITQHFPHTIVSILQWFAFWTFSGLLTVPWLMCIYQLVTHSLGRTKKIKYILDEIAAPKVVVVMPCYKELPDILLRTVDSIVDCDYPSACLHIFLSFDGDQEDDLYLNTIEKLGIPIVRQSGYPTSIDVTYRQTRITVSRFPHGGKRHCQKRTFRLIDKIYNEYLAINDNLFVLFIDSDCILDKVCIQNFMYEMELKPGSQGNMLAMTGIITATTEKNTLLTLLQDIEYIHGQLFERSVESGCGAVTCLPGALTILRFSAFRKLAKYYFADKAEQCDDLFDYAEKRYQIGLATNSFLKTESVQTYKSLLKQRRRWFLGFITNEVCMITDIRLWVRYPVLCIVRFAQNTIRTTALLFFIMVISLLSTAQTVEDLPVGFIAVSLGLNWALMIYFAVLLGRYKIILYPILFIKMLHELTEKQKLGPFFNWLYMVYGIFTAGQRTWGGPRADAGQADSTTSPQAAIEHAEATGDDLNVVPETFRPALAARRMGRSLTLPRVGLQPSDHLAGRLRPGARGSADWLYHPQGLDVNGQFNKNLLTRSATVQNTSLPHHRLSLDSNASFTSTGTLVQFPRRAESFMDLEDARTAIGRGRAHPPSAQSAFFEARRDQSRYGSSTLTWETNGRLPRSPQASSENPDSSTDQQGNRTGHGHTRDIPLVNLGHTKDDKQNPQKRTTSTNKSLPRSPQKSIHSLYQNPFATPNVSQSDLFPIDQASPGQSRRDISSVSHLRADQDMKLSATFSTTKQLLESPKNRQVVFRDSKAGTQGSGSETGSKSSKTEGNDAQMVDSSIEIMARAAPPSSFIWNNTDLEKGEYSSVAGSESSSESTSKKHKKLQKRKRTSV